MAAQILQDEVEHKEDLRPLPEVLDVILKK